MEQTVDLREEELSLWDRLEREVEKGIAGKNKGIAMGFPKLSRYVSNIQPGRYDLIGGATGTGKTAFVDSAYVYNPLSRILTDPDPQFTLKILYYSIEIPPLQKIAKMVCRKLYEDYNIQLDAESLFTKGERQTLGRDIATKVFSYRDYFERIVTDNIIFHSSASPDYVWMTVKEYVEANGTIKQEGGIIHQYIPHKPNEIVVIIIDHISLIDKNKRDSNKKEAIDRLSKMLVAFRNIFNISAVVVSQFNRGIEGMDRRKLDAVEPQLSDFKDTGSTQEDCNTALSLFYPFKYGIEKHNGYDIRALHRYYRSLSILKNRDGVDNLTMGMFFMGQNGIFKELPLASQLKEDANLYSKILSKVNGN